MRNLIVSLKYLYLCCCHPSMSHLHVLPGWPQWPHTGLPLHSCPFQSIHKPKWSIINTDQATVSSPTHYVPLFHSVHQTPNTLAFWLREHAMFFYYLSWTPRMVCSTSCFRSQFNCHFPSEAFHDQHQSFLIFFITKLFFFIAFFSSCNCLIYLLFFGVFC